MITKELFVSLLFIFIQAASSTYDDSLARNKFYAMASVAHSDNPEPCLKHVFNDSEFVRQITIQCDSGKGDTCSGFTAISHSDQAIFIAFRGTTGDDEMQYEIGDTLFKSRVPFYGYGSVDDYFYNATNLLWNAGMKNDFFTAKNKYPSYEVWVTGHSLGGAEASVYAALISALGYVTPDKVKLITMGQPRVGDKAFADAHAKLVPYSYRVVHANDWVPALPPVWFEGYTHHQSEVWYDNDMAVGSPYIVCNAEESNNCSDSQLDTNHGDHDDYFGLSVHYMSQCRGYLFHDPTGTGKMSIILALVSHFGYSVFVMSLCNPNLYDDQLNNLINNLNEKTFLVLEDVNVAFTSREDGEEDFCDHPILNLNFPPIPDF